MKDTKRSVRLKIIRLGPLITVAMALRKEDSSRDSLTLEDRAENGEKGTLRSSHLSPLFSPEIKRTTRIKVSSPFYDAFFFKRFKCHTTATQPRIEKSSLFFSDPFSRYSVHPPRSLSCCSVSKSLTPFPMNLFPLGSFFLSLSSSTLSLSLFILPS